MKNRMFKIVMALLIAVVIMPKNVLAATELCTVDTKQKLVKQAMGVKISYKPIKTDENKYEFAISILNMPDFVYAEMDELDEELENEEGLQSISLPTTLPGNKSYKIKFYVRSGLTCEDELVYVKNFDLPKYNIYSELDECIEYEEFPLCSMYYSGEIKNLKEFNEKLEEYKEKLKGETPPEEEELTVMQKVINFYTGNLAITLPVTIAIIGGVAFVIVKFFVLNKKSKKIGIDEFIGE